MIRAIKLNPSILLLFTMFISACGFNGSAQEKQAAQQKQSALDKLQTMEKQEAKESTKNEWVDYLPAVVELKGILSVETFFGPPNFGENPKSDSQEKAWILSLDKPINVRGRTGPDVAYEYEGVSVEDVRKLQLVLPKPHRELIGMKVIVKGTLFHAHTGHHHTDVLLDVQSISLTVANKLAGGEVNGWDR